MRTLIFVLLMLPVVSKGQFTEFWIGWPFASENTWKINNSVLLNYKTDYQDEYLLTSITQDGYRMDWPAFSARIYAKQFLFAEPEIRYSQVIYETNDNFTIKQNNFISGAYFGVTRPVGKIKPFLKTGINAIMNFNKLDEAGRPELVAVFQDLWKSNSPLVSLKAEAGIQYKWLYAAISYATSINKYDLNGLFDKQTEFILFNLGIRIYKTKIHSYKKIYEKKVNYSVSNKVRMPLTKFDISWRFPLRMMSLIHNNNEINYAYAKDGTQHVVKISKRDFRAYPSLAFGIETKKSIINSNRIYTFFNIYIGMLPHIYKFKEAYKTIDFSTNISYGDAGTSQQKNITYGSYVVGGHFPGLGIRTIIGRFGSLYFQAAVSHWVNIGNDMDQTDDPGAEVFPALKTYIPAVTAETGYKFKRFGIALCGERSILKVHAAEGIKGLFIYQLTLSYEMARN